MPPQRHEGSRISRLPTKLSFVSGARRTRLRVSWRTEVASLQEMHKGGAAMTYYCGIDVAKRKHAVAILDERGQAHKPVFQTENTHAGMELLLGVLQDLGG